LFLYNWKRVLQIVELVFGGDGDDVIVNVNFAEGGAGDDEINSGEG